MTNANNLRRGSVYLVNLDPVIGHEQGKTRPCLIISDDRFNNSKADLIVVLPMTTKVQQNPWSIKIESKATGLNIDSYVLCAQIITISKKRLCSDELGYLDNKYFSLINERLGYLISL